MHHDAGSSGDYDTSANNTADGGLAIGMQDQKLEIVGKIKLLQILAEFFDEGSGRFSGQCERFRLSVTLTLDSERKNLQPLFHVLFGFLRAQCEKDDHKAKHKEACEPSKGHLDLHRMIEKVERHG